MIHGHGPRQSKNRRRIPVQEEVSVKRASANSSGVATFGPIDCNAFERTSGRGRARGVGDEWIHLRLHVSSGSLMRAKLSRKRHSVYGCHRSADMKG